MHILNYFYSFDNHPKGVVIEQIRYDKARFMNTYLRKLVVKDNRDKAIISEISVREMVLIHACPT